jgi:hypothetical protein
VIRGHLKNHQWLEGRRTDQMNVYVSWLPPAAQMKKPAEAGFLLVAFISLAGEQLFQHP